MLVLKFSFILLKNINKSFENSANNKCFLKIQLTIENYSTRNIKFN